MLHAIWFTVTLSLPTTKKVINRDGQGVGSSTASSIFNLSVLWPVYQIHWNTLRMKKFMKKR